MYLYINIKMSSVDINHLFNLYELQIRNFKNAEYDQLHSIYVLRVGKEKIDKIMFECVSISLDFLNNYTTIKENHTVNKRELLDNIMKQIFNDESCYTEVLITYLNNRHKFIVRNVSYNELLEANPKKDGKKLLKKIDKNNRIKEKITILMKKILKID